MVLDTLCQTNSQAAFSFLILSSVIVETDKKAMFTLALFCVRLKIYLSSATLTSIQVSRPNVVRSIDKLLNILNNKGSVS